MVVRILHYSDLENAFDSPERLGRLVSALRSESTPESIIIGTGDELAPSVLSLTHRGNHTKPFFESIEPDIETFGNHDFDIGIDAFREFITNSAVDWVCANVYEDEHTFANVPKWKRIETGDGVVGIIGIIGPSTSVPEQLDVKQPTQAVSAIQEEISDKVDQLVVAAHSGIDTARSIAGLNGTDLVLNGHLHRVSVEEVDGTPVVTSGVNGEVIREIELSDTYQIRDIDVSSFDEHTPTRDAVKDMKHDAGLLETVAVIDTPIRCDRGVCFEGRCDILQTVTEAYRWAGNADIGFVDTRALRNRPQLHGEVTAYDLVGLIPFKGPLKICSVTGSDLISLLNDAIRSEDGYRDREAGQADWMGQFSGAQFDEIRDGTLHGLRTDDGPISEEQTYRVATNPYVVGTEAEFNAVNPQNVVSDGCIQYDAVIDYVREYGFATS